MNEIITFIGGILGLAGRLITTIISFVVNVGNFGVHCILMVYHYLGMIVNIVPNFLKPLLSMIIVIRLIKFFTKRGNQLYHTFGSSHSKTDTVSPQDKITAQITQEITEAENGGK